MNTDKWPIFNSGATVSLFILLACFFLVDSNAQAQSPACFHGVKLESSFIAFTTKKDSKLADWYQSTFGMEIAKEFSFPDGTVTGVLMRRGEFVVEVFNRDDTIDPLDYAPGASSEHMRGFMKFGVYTDANLIILKQCLEKQGVNAGRIFNDENLGIDLLQVVDPNYSYILFWRDTCNTHNA